MPVTIAGNNTPTAGGVGYGDGTNLAFTSAGTAGQVLLSNGSSAPTWSAVPTVNLATGVTGTLPIANGGTGSTSTTYCSLTTNVTGTLPAGNGGTGNTFFSVSGPASSTKTYTFPNENMSVGYRNIPAVGTKTSSYTLAVGDVGKYVQISTGGSIVIPTSTFAEGDVISLYNNTTGSITITCSAPTAYIAGTDTIKTSMTLATRGLATILFYSATACVVSGNVS